jgi:hypothetical protein
MGSRRLGHRHACFSTRDVPQASTTREQAHSVEKMVDTKGLQDLAQRSYRGVGAWGLPSTDLATMQWLPTGCQWKNVDGLSTASGR